MIQKLIDAMALIISTNFPDIDIYTESVKQNLGDSCFFLFSMPLSDSRQIGRRWRSLYTICVQYIPSETEPKSQYAEIEEKFYKIFEFLTIDNVIIVCSNAHSEHTDDVLSWFGDYEIFSIEMPVDNPDIMQEQNTNIITEG